MTIGASTWARSLYPKGDGCLVPVRDRCRRVEGLAVDDVVGVRVEVLNRWRDGEPARRGATLAVTSAGAAKEGRHA